MYKASTDKRLPTGYLVKCTDSMGWWVDGCCGYIASGGRYESREEAVQFALKILKEKKK